MVNVIRRFQKPLMIGITAFTIVSFIWFFNKTNITDRTNSGTVAIIYGRPVSVFQYQREGRMFELAAGLQLNDLLQGLLGRDMWMGLMFRQVSEDRAADAYALNSLILRHEAAALGVEPNDAEVDEVVKTIPVFLDHPGGTFDSQKFNEFVSTRLPPLGMSGDSLDQVVRDQVRLRKLKELVGGTVRPADSEVRAAYEEQYRKTDVSVVRLKLDDFKAAVNLTDDDLKKAFDERKDTFKTPEKRKVKYVAFQLDPKKTLPPDERKAAMEKLAEQAGDFSTKMTEKDAKFDEVAAKVGASVQETPEFAESEPPAGFDTRAAQAAFSLTKADPNSDAIVSGKRDGYYVMQLADIAEPRPLTFDEAKTQLTDTLKQERSTEAMNLKASEIRQKLDTEIKAGKSMADAAQAAGVKADPFPTFSMAERKNDSPDGNEIMSTASELRDGELSTFVATSAGGFILHVDKRLPIDEADFAKQKATVAKNLEQRQSAALFDEWMKQRRKAANVQTAQG